MSVVRMGVLSAACLGAAACLLAPTRVPEAPCFDGWSTDQSGASKVWTPNEAQAAALRAIDPEREPVACYHLMPSGRVIVLTVGADAIHSYTATPVGEGYALVSTGAVLEFR